MLATTGPERDVLRQALEETPGIEDLKKVCWSKYRRFTATAVRKLVNEVWAASAMTRKQVEALSVPEVVRLATGQERLPPKSPFASADVVDPAPLA